MSVATVVLPRVSDDGPRVAAPVTGTWDLDLDRCALEVNYAMFGVPLWRARLRPLEARIVLAERAEDGTPVAGGLVRLSATVAVQPAYTSPPATRDWFLPATPRSEQIRIAGNAFPHDDGAVYTLARMSTDEDLWWTRLTVRFTLVHDERAVVAVGATIARRRDAPFPRTPVRVEMAAEFVRCA
jgi:hypothetical protein